MSLLDSIASHFHELTDDGYECGGCGISFEERRANCPACGSVNIRRAAGG